MNKKQLTDLVNDAKANAREVLQTVYDELNQGQKKKIVKNDKVRAQFDLHGVVYEE